MIHRAILGSLERFIGMMIEHFAGKFPLWLAPEQIRILTITDRSNEFAQEVLNECKEAGLRASIIDDQMSLNKKIREAQLAQVNYIIVIGDKEVEEKQINVRTRTMKQLGSMSVDEFKTKLIDEVHNKTLPEDFGVEKQE